MSVIKFIYRLLWLVYYKIRSIFIVNWIKTIYFNLSVFPFRIAIKLPVFFYGSVKFNSLTGLVLIDAPIKTGMIKFGINLELIKRSAHLSEIMIEGTLVFKGTIKTGVDYVLIVLKDGYLEIGSDSYIGSRIKIVCAKSIVLGRYFGLSYESQIIDTNFHYLVNLKTREVKDKQGNIVIGDRCWIGNRTSIMKDTIIPMNCIVASNSLCNRNYLNDIPPNSIMGGIPAKLIKTDYFHYSLDPSKESIICNYMKDHIGQVYYDNDI